MNEIFGETTIAAMPCPSYQTLNNTSDFCEMQNALSNSVYLDLEDENVKKCLLALEPRRLRMPVPRK